MSYPDRQNIENLTGFWRCLGATSHPLPDGGRLFASDSWPHRRWVNWGIEPEDEQIGAIVDRVRDDAAAVVPVWNGAESALSRALGMAGLRIGFTLLAMRRRRGPSNARQSSDLALQSVTDDVLADEWARVASESFGYFVEPAVIRSALAAPNLTLLIARHIDEPVGTALLFEDESVVGVHMMGVLPTQRRRGHARAIMHDVLVRAGSERDLVLQASTAGEPLYRSMGFERQFDIPHHVATKP